MADEPTWEGLAKGMLVLGVLWWSWVGYAWLTSVVDPEEDAVRLTIFVAMAALLVVGLCVPGAFDDSALIFALAYAVVRIAHIGLFLLASRDDPLFRKSVVGLACSTAIGSGLLIGASFADGALQGAPVGGRAAARHGRPVLLRRRRLAARAAPLRRAPRADHHHRAGRVDRRDRRRRRGEGRRRDRARRVARDGGGRGAVVAVLRRRLPRRGAPARRRDRRARPERDGARLVLLHALPDGRRDRARRARHEEDARARRGSR